MVEQSNNDKPIFFVACKIDMLSGAIDNKDGNESILADRKMAIEKLKSMRRLYFECSALTKDGLKTIIDSIIITV
jgi:hypothetical protein